MFFSVGFSADTAVPQVRPVVDLQLATGPESSHWRFSGGQLPEALEWSFADGAFVDVSLKGEALLGAMTFLAW